MHETQIFGVVLPTEVAYRARIVAALQGKSRSRFIRDLLEEYLKNIDEENKISRINNYEQRKSVEL